jgi:hypothetical protein
VLSAATNRWTSSTIDIAFTSITQLQSRRVTSESGLNTPLAAFAISTSSDPSSPVTTCSIASSPSRSARFACTAQTAPPPARTSSTSASATLPSVR